MMTLLRRIAFATLVSSLLVWPREGRADPPPSPPAAPSTSPQSTPGGQPSGTWGWTLLAASIAVGATVTGLSLTIDCRPSDNACAQWTSLGIWGGVGIASVGSTIGLFAVEQGTRRRAAVSIAPGGLGLVGAF